MEAITQEKCVGMTGNGLRGTSNLLFKKGNENSIGDKKVSHAAGCLCAAAWIADFEKYPCAFFANG